MSKSKPCLVTVRTNTLNITTYTARAGAKGKGKIVSRWRTTGNGDHRNFVAENYRVLRTMGYAPIDA